MILQIKFPGPLFQGSLSFHPGKSLQIQAIGIKYTNLAFAQGPDICEKFCVFMIK